MLGLGFWEIALISVAVLIFIRPEELPRVMKRFGQFYGRITGRTEKFYQNFQNSVNPDYEEDSLEPNQIQENAVDNRIDSKRSLT